MSGQTENLRQKALAACQALPESEESHPFGDGSSVFKVGDKMFAVVELDQDPSRITLKSEPEHAAALVHQHEEIQPGYHMNKQHWISLTLVPGEAAGLLDELIENSYGLIFASLPKRDRPAAKD